MSRTGTSRPQPVDELPAFRSQAADTYKSSYTHHYPGHVPDPTMATVTLSKAPDLTKVDFGPVTREPYQASASRWKSTSKATYGTHTITPSLARAQEIIDTVVVDSAPLEGELETATPLTDIPTSAYYHGPMPDRAIKQHFLTKKTTSAVIDGSGADQVIQVPEDSAEPQFYYLRDGDGSRRTLEVRDTSVPDPVPANSSVGGMPVNEQHGNDAVPFSGMSTAYSRQFKDPQLPLDIMEQRARMVTEARLEQSHKGLTYGEQRRITVPKVFKHEMGVATTDRKIEMRVKYMVPDPNPPRATACVADKLIYSAAPDHLTSG